MIRCLIVLASLLAAPAENRWEPNIQRFEEADRDHPPAPGQVLFLGSSSIVGWELDRWFPDLAALNRGFGGSQIIDSIHYFDRVAVPYAPSVIVFYAGDNDVAAGKGAEQVAADFTTLAGLLRDKLPAARLLFVCIKPSPSRWTLWPTMQAANAAIREQCEADPRLGYLDIATPMLAADGTPRRELFRDDLLHLNEAGYELWSGLARAVLDDWLAEPERRRPRRRRR